MKTGRKTTQEERIAIAKDCLENECNYLDFSPSRWDNIARTGIWRQWKWVRLHF